MVHSIKVIGIFILIMSILAVARPAVARTLVEFFKYKKRIYAGGVIRIVIGLLLVIASHSASIYQIPLAIGIFAFLVGYAVFYAVFFVSSIGFLRLRSSAILPFRVCLIVYIALCVLAFIAQAVPNVMFRVVGGVTSALMEAACLAFDVFFVWLILF